MNSTDRPISAVLQDILGNVQDIIRSEVRLAKTELQEEASAAGSASVLAVIGALFAVFCAFCILLAAIYGLSRVMPDWAAALTVAAVTGLIAVTGVVVGMKRFKRLRAVPKTVANIKENLEWAKQQTR